MAGGVIAPRAQSDSQDMEGPDSVRLAAMLAGEYAGAADLTAAYPAYDADGPLLPLAPVQDVPPQPPRELFTASADVNRALREDAETSEEEDLGDQTWEVIRADDGASRSKWFQVGDEPLMNDVPGCITVWAWAAQNVSNWCAGSCTLEQVNATLTSVPRIFGNLKGPCAHDNPAARIPTSMRACQRAIGVRPISQHELHVCWRDGCTHWWRFAAEKGHKHPGGEACQGECPTCVCPRCSTCRWEKGKARKCYFFPQAIEQFFMDPELGSATLRTRTERCPTHERSAVFHRSKRYAELLQTCQKLGIDYRKVCTTLMPKVHSTIDELCAACFVLTNVSSRQCPLCR